MCDICDIGNKKKSLVGHSMPSAIDDINGSEWKRYILPVNQKAPFGSFPRMERLVPPHGTNRSKAWNTPQGAVRSTRISHRNQWKQLLERLTSQISPISHDNSLIVSACDIVILIIEKNIGCACAREDDRNKPLCRYGVGDVKSPHYTYRPF